MLLHEIQALLADFLATGGERLWLVDPEVFFDCDLRDFQLTFDNCGADLLATNVRSYEEDPDWHWWYTLNGFPAGLSGHEKIAALLPLVRFSRDAAAVIVGLSSTRIGGHLEALIPTLLNQSGMKILDICGNGIFRWDGGASHWYDYRTWNWKPPVQFIEGMIHYPVPQYKTDIVWNGPRLKQTSELKLLYVSPVGKGSAKLLPDILSVFRSARADIILLQYEDYPIEVPCDATIIRDAGHKWQLALKHLHPTALENYDYIFFWDDDIAAEGFDPRRFAEIMVCNGLAMAQPAILSSHGFSHEITRQKPKPAPRRTVSGKIHQIVGRQTNFVEIMAPVFSWQSWSNFYRYLDSDNCSGWGYDYINFGRKGIVDVMPVVHTRPVQSNKDQSRVELAKFLDEQGLFHYQHTEIGWLFEEDVFTIGRND